VSWHLSHNARWWGFGGGGRWVAFSGLSGGLVGAQGGGVPDAFDLLKHHQLPRHDLREVLGSDRVEEAVVHRLDHVGRLLARLAELVWANEAAYIASRRALEP